MSCSQVPQKGTQALPAAVGGKELACAGASRAERSTGLQEAVGDPGPGRTSGLGVLLPGCPVSCTGNGMEGTRFLLKNVQNKTLLDHLPL